MTKESPTRELDEQKAGRTVEIIAPRVLRRKRDLIQRMIARRAYELFELRGRIPGHQREDWAQAESGLFGRAKRCRISVIGVNSRIAAWVIGAGLLGTSSSPAAQSDLHLICLRTYNPRLQMRIVLAIADVIVVLALVITISRAVWRGQSDQSRSLLLSACIVLALLIFALVSFTAAYGLAESSSFNQLALLIVLVVIAIVARSGWANRPVQ